MFGPTTCVPAGAWLCPTCLATGLTVADVTTKLKQAHQADVSEKVHHPAPATKQRDAAALALHGRFVQRKAERGKGVRWGRLHFTGAAKRPGYFDVLWDDGTLQQNVTQAKIAKEFELQPEGAQAPRMFQRRLLPAAAP